MGIRFRAVDAMGNVVFRFLVSTIQESTLEEAGTVGEGHNSQHPLHLATLHLGFYPHWKSDIPPRFSGTLFYLFIYLVVPGLSCSRRAS